MAKHEVFLCYHSSDQQAVKTIALRLRERRLSPWFAEWESQPGLPWQRTLEAQIPSIGAAAVFIGPEGVGHWQQLEIDALLRQFVMRSCPVIPVILPGCVEDPTLSPFLEGMERVDFRSTEPDPLERLIWGITGKRPASIVASPTQDAHEAYRCMAPRPDTFVERREIADVLHALSAYDDPRPTVGLTTALRGAGGFGKTTLAQELCQRAEVRAAFPDGILWTTMGNQLREGERLSRLLDLIRWWTGDDPPNFESTQTASAYLRKLLDGKKVLLVVDDAWSYADVEPFRGTGSALLITTRDRRTLPSNCSAIDIDTLQVSEAVELLGSGLPAKDDPRFATLARRLGEWPLLLGLVNGRLRQRIHRGLSIDVAMKRIEEELDEFGITAFDVADESIRCKSARGTLDVSLRSLDNMEREHFLKLSVFPEDAEVPLDLLASWWSMSRVTVERLCERLYDLSLLRRFDPVASVIRLHDVVRDYLLEKTPSREEFHRELLARCRPESGLWKDLSPLEGYLWRHLAYHLAEAEDLATLGSLLFDYDYLEAKLAAADVNSLLGDYEVLICKENVEAETARLVQGALRLSSNVLAKHPRQLAVQILGRLAGLASPNRAALLLREAKRRTPLRPRKSSLIRPGGPLIRTLKGHDGMVLSVAYIGKGRVVSSSADKTLRVWDINSGDTLGVLEGHNHWVNSVADLGQGRVISASDDRTLRVWDVDRGIVISVLEGHREPVKAVIYLDHGLVASSSEDTTIRIWNADSGATLRVLEGHSKQVNALAYLGGDQVVSASEDGTLRVWKINSGDIQWVFKGHTDAVKAVTSMGDGLIASSSLDLTLRVWKLGSAEPLHVIGPTFANALLGVSKEILIADSIRGRLAIWNVVSGDSLVELDGHTSWVNAVVTVGDGRIVSASADETLRLWDLASPQQWERRSEDHSGRVNAVTCLSDGCVVTASDDWTLMIWDPDSGEALHVLEGHTGRVTAVTELGDGLIVSASDDNTLRVWDIESCITLRVLEGSGLSIVNLGNGRFVSPSSDNTLRVWRVDSDEALQVLIGHKAPVVAVADLGKRQITSLSLDLTLRVWDLDSGDTLREIREVKFHRVIDLGQRSILALHSMKLWIGDDSSCNSTGAQADPTAYLNYSYSMVICSMRSRIWALVVWSLRLMITRYGSGIPNQANASLFSLSTPLLRLWL